MAELDILRIEVDELRRLRVFPERASSEHFTQVYRAGAEVNWEYAGYFYSPPPREWTYTRWLQQIVSAVRGELGLNMRFTPHTQFVSVSPEDVDSMRKFMAKSA
jgi:hypothetical protein